MAKKVAQKKKFGGPQEGSGRPLKQIDPDQVYKLALIHCTAKEIAAVLQRRRGLARTVRCYRGGQLVAPTAGAPAPFGVVLLAPVAVVVVPVAVVLGDLLGVTVPPGVLAVPPVVAVVPLVRIEDGVVAAPVPVEVVAGDRPLTG